jgi:transposase
MISSIRYNGAITAMTVNGATDAIVFEEYISKILCPTLCKNDIVVMDNLRAHKASGIQNAIKATGATLLYLPPYSPDFNPIEKMWSKIKAYLRKVKARSAEVLDESISDAFRSITDLDARGWFLSCGYVLIHS